MSDWERSFKKIQVENIKAGLIIFAIAGAVIGGYELCKWMGWV